MKAKIKSKESIDWNKAQLLTSEKGTIVMSCGEHLGLDFTGVILNCTGDYPIGYTSKSWDKRSFRLFNGKITLEND